MLPNFVARRKRTRWGPPDGASAVRVEGSVCRMLCVLFLFPTVEDLKSVRKSGWWRVSGSCLPHSTCERRRGCDSSRTSLTLTLTFERTVLVLSTRLASPSSNRKYFIQVNYYLLFPLSCPLLGALFTLPSPHSHATAAVKSPSATAMPFGQIWKVSAVVLLKATGNFCYLSIFTTHSTDRINETTFTNCIYSIQHLKHLEIVPFPLPTAIELSPLVLSTHFFITFSSSSLGPGTFLPLTLSLSLSLSFHVKIERANEDKENFFFHLHLRMSESKLELETAA